MAVVGAEVEELGGVELGGVVVVDEETAALEDGPAMLFLILSHLLSG